MRNALLALLLALLAAAPAEARDTRRPTVKVTAPASGSTVSGVVTVQATAADNVAVRDVTFRVDGAATTTDSSAPYSYAWDTTKTSDGTHVVSARAVDTAGNVSASPDPSSTVTVKNEAAPPPPPPSPSYSMQPSHTGLAHDSAYCAANHGAFPERRPENDAANHTLGSPALAVWADNSYWSKWIAKRDQVDGQATGTTDELIQWAACKWGVDEDLLRAVAVQESDWRQAVVGDYCGIVGQGSYSIIQIKNRYCNGGLAWGGFPQTQQSTAFALDFYGAQFRACYDGDWYDGGQWLYKGKTVDQVAAASGWEYVEWGCVGSWFSGGWYDTGAQGYITSVKRHLAGRDWTGY